MNFADAGGSPFSQAQLHSMSFPIIQKTGIFTKECRKWRKKPPADKTWINYCNYFCKAYADYKEDLQLSTTGSAFNANTASTTSNAQALQDS